MLRSACVNAAPQIVGFPPATSSVLPAERRAHPSFGCALFFVLVEWLRRGHRRVRPLMSKIRHFCSRRGVCRVCLPPVKSSLRKHQLLLLGRFFHFDLFVRPTALWCPGTRYGSGCVRDGVRMMVYLTGVFAAGDWCVFSTVLPHSLRTLFVYC